jgi:hypothetical protein
LSDINAYLGGAVRANGKEGAYIDTGKLFHEEPSSSQWRRRGQWIELEPEDGAWLH